MTAVRRLHAALLGGIAVSLVGWRSSTPAAADSVQEAFAARPAVLVLRVSPAAEPEPPRVEALQTRFIGRWPTLQLVQLEGEVELRDGIPQPGEGYALDRVHAPEPSTSGERYYFYHLDLGHPDTVRNWQDLQRAEREEARQAAAEAQNLHQWQRRKLQLLRANSQATESGIAALRAGKFREALIALTRAADLDEGDPICRIHLVQARVALGHDAEAARVLRRALELQPKLVSLRLNLETYYAEAGVFDDHVNALKTRVKRRRNAPNDLHFLLGFMEFQRGHYDDAYGQFARIASAEPGNEYVQKYLELTRPAGR